MEDAFREADIKEVYIEKMPPMAAKRLSPLDNSPFHDWKEAVRRRGPLTLQNVEQIMSDEWNNIAPAKIQAHYRHCGLVVGRDEYEDCPDPVAHNHRQRQYLM